MTCSKSSTLEYLHIGKTAGTSFRVILENSPDIAKSIHYNDHQSTILDFPPGTGIIFTVRSPIRRFVSAFYHRKKKLHRHQRSGFDDTWTKREIKALYRFKTINHLCSEIFSSNKLKSLSARFSMSNIMHLGNKGTYWYWFHDYQTLEERVNDIFYVLQQESFSEDVERLSNKLGAKSYSIAKEKPGSYGIENEPLDPDYKKPLARYLKNEYDFISWLKMKGHLPKSYLENEFILLDNSPTKLSHYNDVKLMNIPLPGFNKFRKYLQIVGRDILVIIF